MRRSARHPANIYLLTSRWHVDVPIHTSVAWAAWRTVSHKIGWAAYIASSRTILLIQRSFAITHIHVISLLGQAPESETKHSLQSGYVNLAILCQTVYTRYITYDARHRYPVPRLPQA